MVSKKNAKGKAAASRVASGSLVVTAEQARCLLPRLCSATLTSDDRLLLLNATENGKPVASNRNPLFYGDLIPTKEGGFRRDGIWKRSVEAVVQAEPGQSKQSRDVYSTPAGLANLGNTCYANSALQLLYTNCVFRDAVYRIEEDVIDNDSTGMLRELRMLFLDMQFRDHASADPRSFANMLKLQASEQQDAQEFQKLLMQRLEQFMDRSADPMVRQLLMHYSCSPPVYGQVYVVVDSVNLVAVHPLLTTTCETSHSATYTVPMASPTATNVPL